jgi:hypothetical protein
LEDIDSNLLVFTPVANANGTSYTSFNFKVRDDGGTAHGGVNTDASSNTLTINVTSVNDAPSGADKPITITEDTPLVFTLADFGFTDIDANGFMEIKLNNTFDLPEGSTLTNNGYPVSGMQWLSATDIAAGNFIFSPASNASGVAYISLEFKVHDDGGTSDGGFDLDETWKMIIIHVTPANDAPTANIGMKVTTEDTPLDVDLRTLVEDVETAIADLVFTVGSTVNGSVTLLTDGYTARFTPAANYHGGMSQAHFTYSVTDTGEGSTAALTTGPVMVYICVGSTNDAPTADPTSLTTDEDTAVDVDLRTLVSDVETANVDLTFSVTEPVNGSGTLLADGYTARFTPSADYNGTGASFTYSVTDAGEYMQDPLTTGPVTIGVTVNSVSDAPELDTSGAPVVTAFETGNNVSDSVAAIVVAIVVDGSITDGEAVEAIAVTAVENVDGFWQYSIDSGTTWNDFSTGTGWVDLTTVAVLLDSSSLIRFHANPSITSGSPSFKYRAWDKSSGSEGDAVDVSINGGNTAFSIAEEMATIS